jgi:hypothetical protein
MSVAFVIPAEAGIQGFRSPTMEALDSRLRGNDGRCIARLAQVRDFRELTTLNFLESLDDA